MSARTDVELLSEKKLNFPKLESTTSIEVIIVPDLIDDRNNHLAFFRWQEIFKWDLVLSGAPAIAEAQVLYFLFKDSANNQNNLTHRDGILLVKVEPHDSVELLVRDGLVVAKLFDNFSDDFSEPWNAQFVHHAFVCIITMTVPDQVYKVLHDDVTGVPDDWPELNLLRGIFSWDELTINKLAAI